MRSALQPGLPGAERSERLRQMLDRAISDPSWKRYSLEPRGGAAGWCGWLTPNTASSNGVDVVMDGAIYNRRECGIATPDAALFLLLYREHGFEGALARINGDFAIAVFDSVEGSLWLARDRFGLKPLFYAQTRDALAFASRPKSLLAFPGVSSEPNAEFIGVFAGAHYRYFDNRPHQSPYRNICQLPAGHFLHFEGGTARLSSYWSLRDQPDLTDSEDALAERYRDLLLDAVSLRLKESPKPGFTLSGGMDSSSVLASAVKLTGEKRHAFSVVYVDKTYDETEEIRSMLEANVEKWHAVSIDVPDTLSVIRRMVEAHDEPVATATWLSHFLLCEEASKLGFTALFGGLGGDELNAGEYEYFPLHFADLRAGGQERVLDQEIELWVKYHDHPVFKKSRARADEIISQLADLSRPGHCLPDRRRLTRYARAIRPEFFELASYEPVMEHVFSSYLKNRSYQDITRETAPCCLRAEDRQTVAFGMENFLPFFDHRLVEFMFRIPGTLKIRDGVTKHLLRRATRGLLPEETRTRIKKTGWNAPVHLWFSGKQLAPFMDLVRSRKFRERGIYDCDEVERIIREHEEIVTSGLARENHMMFLWQLANLELWLQSIAEP